MNELQTNLLESLQKTVDKEKEKLSPVELMEVLSQLVLTYAND